MINWIPVAEQKPNPEKPVIVALAADRWTKQRVARAAWIPKHFKEDVGDFEGDVDWDEDKDLCYWPEGWYEWNEYEDTHWCIDDKVTHWAEIELPQQPHDGAEGG